MRQANAERTEREEEIQTQSRRQSRCRINCNEGSSFSPLGVSEKSKDMKDKELFYKFSDEEEREGMSEKLNDMKGKELFYKFRDEHERENVVLIAT